MKIAIFGAGPSGLFAYWACEQAGINIDDVTLFTDKVQKPVALGFQYLHEKCGLTLKSYLLKEEILQKDVPLDVSSSLYSLKVYGVQDVKNSVTKLDAKARTIIIHNMNEALNFLWNRYKSRIIVKKINFLDLVKNHIEFDQIFSSVPVDILKNNDIDFITEYSYVSIFKTKECINYVNYDISPSNPIFRYGVLFGNFFIESKQEIYPNSYEMKKVVSKNINIKLPSNIHLIGRYGTWDKSIMVHDVYNYVKGKVNE